MTAIGRSAPAVAVLAKWTVDEQQLGVARRPSGPSAVARAPAPELHLTPSTLRKMFTRFFRGKITIFTAYKY